MSFSQLLVSTLGQNIEEGMDDCFLDTSVDTIDNMVENLYAQVNAASVVETETGVEATESLAIDADSMEAVNTETETILADASIVASNTATETIPADASIVAVSAATETPADASIVAGNTATESPFVDTERTNSTTGNGHDVDDDSDGDDEPAAKKTKKGKSANNDQIRKNRNATKQFNTLKKKVERFQAEFSAETNFVLIMENNFVKKVGTSGPTPATTEKVLVIGKGELMDKFRSDNLNFDLESMEVLKTGVRGMVPDANFLKEYTKLMKGSPPIQLAASAIVTPPRSSFQQQIEMQQQLLFQQQQMHLLQYPFFQQPSMVQSSPFVTGSGLVTSPAASSSSTTASASMDQTVSASVETTTTAKKKNLSKKKNLPKKSKVFEISSEDEDSLMEDDLVDDSSDYSEEDQNFINLIERKNLQRKKKTTLTVSSDSDNNLEESDHGCEVRGAGAEKQKKSKRKVGAKAAGKRKTQKKSNDILPDIIAKKPTKAATKKKTTKKAVPAKTLASTDVDNLQQTLPTKKTATVPRQPRARRAIAISEGSINKLLFTPTAGSSKTRSVSPSTSDTELRTPKRIVN